MCKKLDLSMAEVSEFSDSGFLRKRFTHLPEGLSIGQNIQLGHWSAEVMSIERREDELQKCFVIGFRMRF